MALSGCFLEMPPIKPMGIPEWEHLNYIATVSTIECNAHYSYLIENLMDMYHGHLHQDWQAWTDAVLEDIEEDANRVDAHYQAQSYYKIDKIWSISQLFFPSLATPPPRTIGCELCLPALGFYIRERFQDLLSTLSGK
jgi:phenylpropionate dioxygenase-like ring-hydroxylating dioxygenase large terminal subunit